MILLTGLASTDLSPMPTAVKDLTLTLDLKNINAITTSTDQLREKGRGIGKAKTSSDDFMEQNLPQQSMC